MEGMASIKGRSSYVVVQNSIDLCEIRICNHPSNYFRS